MPSAEQSAFKGVTTYFNPNFVSDILCPGPSGNLLTIKPIEDSPNNIINETITENENESTFQCHFVSKNETYILGIEYPDEPPVKEMIFKKPEVRKKEKLSFANRILNDR